ncbi:MAG TPA: hypothetical protein DIU09_03875 [Hyphomonadaceae bacterium]|nr:hypothetical protein [Hyphomonadaceae bacterium]
MTEVMESSSHYYPEVIRVQYQTPFNFVAGFLYSTARVEMTSHRLWTVIDETVARNSRWYRPKPTRFFLLEFSPARQPLYFRLEALNATHLVRRPTGSVPKCLEFAANKISNRDGFHGDPTRGSF